MKKNSFLTAVMAIWLCIHPASAETLALQLNVPTHIYHRDLQTGTGFTTISFDATVEMPNISSVSTYEVRLRTIGEEEAKTIIESFGIDSAEVVYTEDRDQSTWTYLNYWEKAFDASGKTHSIHFRNGFVKDIPVTATVQIHPKSARLEYVAGDSLLPYTMAQPTGSAFSQEEAICIAEDIAAKIAPDLSLNLVGYLPGQSIATGYEPQLDSKNGDMPSPPAIFPYGHGLIFSRNIDGIPITITSQLGAGDPNDSFSPPFPAEQLYIVISEKGVDNAEYRSPYEIISRLQENIALLSFERIMEIAKETIPLKLVTTEGLNERITQVEHQITIHHIKFGYMRVKMRDQSNRYEMVPVWDFFASENRKYFWDNEWHINCDFGMMNSLLTINAIDGTIIDRDLGY
jgi:hypothetical protein